MTTLVTPEMTSGLVTTDDLSAAVGGLNSTINSHIVDGSHLSNPLDLTGKTLFMPAAFTPVFTKSFTSTQQAITAGGLLTLAHGMGVAPRMIQAELVCISAELNWVAGDRQFVAITCGTDSALNRGITVYSDTTNVYVRFGTAPSPFVLANKNTGATAAMTVAKWELVIRAAA